MYSLVMVVLVAGFSGLWVNTAASAPGNWPSKHVAMGGAISGPSDLFSDTQLEAVSIYGTALSNAAPTDISGPSGSAVVLINVANSFNQSSGNPRKVVPVLVEYTTSASVNTTGGIVGMGQALTTDSMTSYLNSLKADMDSLTSAWNSVSGLPAPSIIVNPSFLGTLQANAQQIPDSTPSSFISQATNSITAQLTKIGYVKHLGKEEQLVLITPWPGPLSVADAENWLMLGGSKCTYGTAPASIGVPVCINDALRASSFWADVHAKKKTFDNDLNGYLQAINWIIRNYSPKGTTIGVQASANAVWCSSQFVCKNDSNWVHYVSLSSDIQSLANQLTVFWSNLAVFSGGDKADFIVFDKNSVNGLSPYDNSFADGFLYNQSDFDNFISFVGYVAKGLKVPAMLWQFPGGHISASMNNIGMMSTEAQYVFGQSGMGAALTNPLLSTVNTTKPTYKTANTAQAYLADGGSSVWPSHINQLRNANIFAVLWGDANCSTSIGMFPYPNGVTSTTNCGDVTTEVTGSSDPADQAPSQWLKNIVARYYSTIK